MSSFDDVSNLTNFGHHIVLDILVIVRCGITTSPRPRASIITSDGRVRL